MTGPIPKHVEVLPSLPKTAVGKILKPELRKRAIARVLDTALHDAGLQARVALVVEDRKRGLVAQVQGDVAAEGAAVGACLGAFAVAWDWVA